MLFQQRSVLPKSCVVAVRGKQIQTFFNTYENLSEKLTKTLLPLRLPDGERRSLEHTLSSASRELAESTEFAADSSEPLESFR